VTPSPPSRRPLEKIGDIFDARIQTLTTPHRCYRVAAHRFLSYLQTHFPQLLYLSELRRDPHLLGWIRCLSQQDPPLAYSTRRIYLVALRCLLRDFASEGHCLQSDLILSEESPRITRATSASVTSDVDFPPRPPLVPTALSPEKDRWLQPRLRRIGPCSRLPHPIFEEIFGTHIQTLATTLRPGTVKSYRLTVRRFLSYLQTDFPQLRDLSELRRDPHLLGWLRYLCQQDPPLSNGTRCRYLFCLRRLLHGFAFEGHLQPGLILPEDFPPQPQYLPRALSPEDDQRLQQELRRTNDLLANALLLTRATGIRIGECIDLARDCLRWVGQDQWALHVPIGKLYTERLVPVDEDIRQMVTRILALRELDPLSHLVRSAGLLLPRSAGHDAIYDNLRNALLQAAERADCSHRITCHQLRHTYATEMLRLGVSLPALMKLLGHKNLNMTLRYLQVTQQDLQREFHLALQNTTQRHLIPKLPLPDTLGSASSDIPGICRALAAARHLLEMYRRQLDDEKSHHRLQRLENRLMAVASELERFGISEK
jgi:site-specific recombinase XerD